MVGLSFVDQCVLSPAQWIALVLSMATIISRELSWKVLAICQALLLAVFWNVALSVDTRLLCQSSFYLSRFSWHAFLSELPFRDYVKLQPPFYTFWFSRWPWFPLHQCLQAFFAFGCGLLMLEIYGNQAKYLLSTPLYLLMSTQPGNDFILFGVIVMVLRCLQWQRRGWAALIYGMAFALKPTMILAAPFLVRQLKGWLLISGGMIAEYLWWTMPYYFGRMQWNFLLQQLLLSKFFAH